jgi:outer membrane lipoprotein-sorting protein
MKKLLFVFSAFALSLSLSAQTLEEIIAKQSAALQEAKFDNLTSLKTTGTISQMGMEMQSTIWYKAPNKIKVVIAFNGQEIVQAFDGEQGYMINPMMGTTDPQPLPASQTESMKNNSSLKSPLSKYVKEGKLALEGSEDVDGQSNIISGYDDSGGFGTDNRCIPDLG